MNQNVENRERCKTKTEKNQKGSMHDEDRGSGRSRSQRNRGSRRRSTELEAVKGLVQTECNALRDLFARTTTALSSSGSQHDLRLNHREAGRHLPQQFGGSRFDCGDFAFRMEGYAAVLSRDGQGGALLREVAKLEKFEDNTIETLGRTFWDVPRRGGNAGKKNSQCEPQRWSSNHQWWNKRRRWRGSYRQIAPRT